MCQWHLKNRRKWRMNIPRLGAIRGFSLGRGACCTWSSPAPRLGDAAELPGARLPLLGRSDGHDPDDNMKTLWWSGSTVSRRSIPGFWTSPAITVSCRGSRVCPKRLIAAERNTLSSYPTRPILPSYDGFLGFLSQLQEKACINVCTAPPVGGVKVGLAGC